MVAMSAVPIWLRYSHVNTQCWLTKTKVHLNEKTSLGMSKVVIREYNQFKLSQSPILSYPNTCLMNNSLQVALFYTRPKLVFIHYIMRPKLLSKLA